MRNAKVDANHGAILAALRAAGCSVQSLATVGRGCPDLLVAGPDGDLHLMEIKDGSKPPSKRRLTPDESRWISAWRGSVHVVHSPEGALAVVGAVKETDR